jgi:hypothetical protein
MVICLTVAFALLSISAKDKRGCPVCDMTITLQLSCIPDGVALIA